MAGSTNDSLSASIEGVKVKPSIAIGISLYLGYLAVVFTLWTINGVEYTKIGETLESTRLHYAYPTLAGSLFLLVAITVLGWWRPVFFDRQKSGPGWAWILPVAMLGFVVFGFMSMQADNLTTQLVLWSTLGALGVGFGEEVATRGTLLVGFRNSLSEGKVWLWTTLLFSALHAPNVIFGMPLTFMLVQLLFTFIMGSALYVVRRISGTLILPVLLHGLWDSSVFLPRATGAEPGSLSAIVYVIAIVCAVAVIRRNWHIGATGSAGQGAA